MAMQKLRPKTGERRKREMPLYIERLPKEVPDKILELRAQGKTWKEIEVLSHDFVKWDDLPISTLELFPNMRIPHTNLHRWYDLRVDQVRKEVLVESEASRRFAESLLSGGLDHASEIVMSAMRDAVFTFTKDADPASRSAYLKGLDKLGLTISRLQRVDLQRKRVEADLAKIDAERAKIAAEAGDPREIYLLAAQDILKKLRTRKSIREAIDPIQEDLIQEYTYAADSFAKQIEASAS